MDGNITILYVWQQRQFTFSKIRAPTFQNALLGGTLYTIPKIPLCSLFLALKSLDPFLYKLNLFLCQNFYLLITVAAKPAVSPPALYCIAAFAFKAQPSDVPYDSIHKKSNCPNTIHPSNNIIQHILAPFRVYTIHNYTYIFVQCLYIKLLNFYYLYIITHMEGAMEYLHIRIIELLQEKGISKTRICKDLDFQRGNFNRYCRDEFQRVDANMIIKLCRYLDCTVGDLFEIRSE